MKLILVRHGETEENKKGICQGQNPGTLSELGINQTKKLAERLKDEKIDYIFSSDLARAADTAKEIARFHKDIPLKFDKRLREMYQGKLQGKIKRKIPGYENPEKRKEIHTLAGSETLEELIERSKDFLEDISKKFKNKNILCVTHGGIISSINSYLLNKSWEEIHKNKETKPKNTAITIFDLTDKKNPINRLSNCTKHLDK